MIGRVFVRSHERGLLFIRGDLQRVLAPGWHWVLGLARRVQIVDTLVTRFDDPQLEVLITHAPLREQLEIVDLADNERAIVWKDGRLLGVFGAGRYAFWRAPATLRIERYDTASFRFEHPQLQTILALPDAAKWFEGVMVNDHETALLFRDGVLIDRLAGGLHVFWKGTGKITWRAIDLRETTLDVAGQEIMTADKVSLRLNLVVGYVVSDALRAVTTTADHQAALYREAQLVLRAAVGTRTLDTILADKESIGQLVRDALAERAAMLGMAVRSVGLRDIILPGDMKTLFNQVIAATKEAEANLIKRREETAAARSQANTARWLAENPLLARLKELEMLKDVLAGTSATFVLGPADLSEQLRTLVASKT